MEGPMLSLEEHMKEEDILKLLSYLECSQLNAPRSHVQDESLVLDIVTETFRCLRNSCANCRRNQDIISRHPQVFQILSSALMVILKKLEQFSELESIQHETPPETVSDGQSPTDRNQDHHASFLQHRQRLLLTAQCNVQFLGNLVTRHPINGQSVWREMKQHVRLLFSVGDDKLTNYTCMLVKNSLTYHVDGCRQLLLEGPEIVGDILNGLSRHHSMEWGLFVVQDLLEFDSFLEHLWEQLENNQRLILLEIMSDGITVENEDEDVMLNNPKINVKNIMSAIEAFITLSHVILHTSYQEEVTDLEPLVLVKLLDILCSASALHHVYREVQDNQELLKSAVNLLQSVHMVGKEGDNMFTSLSKIASSENVDESHPAYALKRELVRLIGNLCYRNKENQDMVRVLNGIPLLLDHTSIDKRNPYISQWSILAIHHLCEDNLENQNALAQLKLQGVSDDVDILKQCGMSVEVKQNKVVVKPSIPKSE